MNSKIHQRMNGKEKKRKMAKLDPSQIPREAKLVSLLLESLGVSDYDPSIIHQLLELSHRHILDILSDAQKYAEHADRKDITVDDVKIAVQGKMMSSFSTPPPKDLLIELAAKKNSMPLPQVPEKFGLRLPTEKHTLLAPNLSIAPKKVTPQVNPSSQIIGMEMQGPDISNIPFVFKDLNHSNPSQHQQEDYDMEDY